VYGAWRHVLFIYPPLVVISALGYNWVAERVKNRASKYVLATIALLLLSEPAIFMVRNHPYEIVYFNPFIGGIKGAIGNYEMDYYYHSTREASEKLKEYIQTQNEDSVIVAGNFETAWFFRDFPAVTKNIYTPYYYKNSKDWDYNIITAAYMTPLSLQPDKWPPKNTIFTIVVNGVPICAVLKRQTKDDWKAIELIEEEQTDSAIVMLQSIISKYPDNETAYLELGKIYLNMARYLLAEETFKECLIALPTYEPAYYYLAEALFKKGDREVAIQTLKKLLTINSKYLLAYINLADYYIAQGKNKDAVDILEKCLTIKPKYPKALEKLEEIKSGKNSKQNIDQTNQQTDK
jgi:tetratricopeptide (TPR) repeat protein